MQGVAAGTMPPPSSNPTATQPRTPSASNSATRPPGLNPGAAAYTATPTTSLYIDTNKTVLLQTARAFVYNPYLPQSPLEVRVLLDGGSQRSYVTTRVKNALSLTSEGEQCMSIITFGSDKRDRKFCEVVRMGMRMKDGQSQELMLFAVPLICKPLSGQPITLCVENYSHLSQLELADSHGEAQLEVDILIGSDYYWELTTGKTCRGESGPVAIHTRLGWVLSGPV